MTEKSYFWGGTTVGDASEAPYQHTAFQQFIRKMFCFDRSKAGVIRAYENELNCTNPSANTVVISTGAAVVDGVFYENTDNVSFTINTPVSSSRSDIIVLRKVWADQTVRLTKVTGSEGSVAPSLTQTDNDTWDIPLWTITITTGGSITLTDNRYFLTALSQIVPTAKGDIAVSSGSSGRFDILAAGNDAQKLIADSSQSVGLRYIDDDFSIPVIIGDGVLTISSGFKIWIQMPFDGEFESYYIAADTTGSIVIDIWKDTHANFPPTVADSITASAKPTLSSARTSYDTTLSGWTKTFNKGDWLLFNVDSASTVKLVTLSLLGRKIATS
ncbi:MAG: hypothetical protein HPY87_08895 [Fervidobacterium sp.]|uniref:hypothetical protein n=1 Tax=Fervidobacterium sp. TaxID=1871331 RepID=UPI0025C4AC72|nr:hypothetical protein [Fervidobacterium sp.]NPU89977.1 hypothetical protein [Fervidobacterium sp.]